MVRRPASQPTSTGLNESPPFLVLILSLSYPDDLNLTWRGAGFTPKTAGCTYRTRLFTSSTGLHAAAPSHQAHRRNSGRTLLGYHNELFSVNANLLPGGRAGAAFEETNDDEVTDPVCLDVSQIPNTTTYENVTVRAPNDKALHEIV